MCKNVTDMADHLEVWSMLEPQKREQVAEKVSVVYL